jgi:hypothetical protein
VVGEEPFQDGEEDELVELLTGGRLRRRLLDRRERAGDPRGGKDNRAERSHAVLLETPDMK